MVAPAPAMVFLGHGKYVRADRIYALEPIGDDRGDGRRTRVWVEGMPEPLIASRTERTILADMEQAGGDATAIRPQPPRPDLAVRMTALPPNDGWQPQLLQAGVLPMQAGLLAPEGGLDVEMVDVPANVLLLRGEAGTVLVDAGSGRYAAGWPGGRTTCPQRWRAGCAPEQWSWSCSPTSTSITAVAAAAAVVAGGRPGRRGAGRRLPARR